MASFLNDGKRVQEYIYDFAVDGGATGEIFLSAKAGKLPIPTGSIITAVTAKVITAVVGSTSTMSWGNDDDPDGYSGTAIAEATLVANFLVNGWDLNAALLWDDTNDHMLYVNVLNADDGDFSVTIAGNALTAGKVIFMVEYLAPSLS